jgi:hypothetical protein
MLLINECRTCNADKTTCPVALGLRKKLEKAGIKERLRYRCREWQKHLKYKVGDKVEFHFVEYSPEWHQGELSGETLVGTIVDTGKKGPVYFVVIDQENRNKIDSEFTKYDKLVWPYHEPADDDSFNAFFGEPTLYTVPVREKLIIGFAE